MHRLNGGVGTYGLRSNLKYHFCLKDGINNLLVDHLWFVVNAFGGNKVHH